MGIAKMKGFTDRCSTFRRKGNSKKATHHNMDTEEFVCGLV